jgi:predicted DNA-binding transcriptional regulator AlpA
MNRNTFLKLMHAGLAPQPVVLRCGRMHPRWRLADIEAWLARGAQQAQSQQATA